MFVSGSMITNAYLLLRVFCFSSKLGLFFEMRKLQLCMRILQSDQPSEELMLRDTMEIMENILLGFVKLYTHRIHGTYIFARIWLVCMAMLSYCREI